MRSLPWWGPYPAKAWGWMSERTLLSTECHRVPLRHAPPRSRLRIWRLSIINCHSELLQLQHLGSKPAREACETEAARVSARAAICCVSTIVLGWRHCTAVQDTLFAASVADHFRRKVWRAS